MKKSLEQKKKPDNSEPLKSLQAKIPESTKNEITGYAMIKGKSVHEFIIEIFEFYKEHHKI